MPVDDINTKSLLHFNGSDGSTTFTDESGKTWTAAGNAQIDTAQSKFGASSLLLDGSGDFVYSGDSLDWRLDDGSNANQWTIDLWVRFNALQNGGFAQQALNNQNNWNFTFNADGVGGWRLGWRITSGGSEIVGISNAWSGVTTNTWYHVALVKNGTSGYMMFVNGNQIGSTQTNTNVIPDLAAQIEIGKWKDFFNTDYYLNGWIDEFRLSKGIARWTANFTPPTAEYGSVSNSNFLALF